MQLHLSDAASWGIEMFKNNPMLYFVTWRLGLQPALTQTTLSERECLSRQCSGRKRLVEIGVWHGVNTLQFRKSMAKDGILFAVDPFPPGRFGLSWHRPIAYGEVSKSSNGTVRFVEDFSDKSCLEFEKQCKDQIDFLFIDGDHSYEGVSLDWTLWTPKVKRGGIVALHDSRSHEGRCIDTMGPARFTRDVVLRDDRFRLVEEVDSLTVLERICD